MSQYRQPSPEASSTAKKKPSSALEAILPRIGYTPEPSEHPSQMGSQVGKAFSLPPITPVSQR